MKHESAVAVRRSKLLLVGFSMVVVLISTTLVGGQTGNDPGCWGERETIYIYGDGDFTPNNGVVSGCGTPAAPYVIEGWRIVAHGKDSGINIEHTTQYFVIRNCAIVGASGAAIHFNTVSNGAIEGCQLVRSERGVLLDNSHCNAIVGNLIAENRYGAVMRLGSEQNVFTGNSFISNGHAAYDPQGENLWYCGGLGNHWSDYEGADCNADGIGDQPYFPVADRFPLMASAPSCGISPMDLSAAFGAAGPEALFCGPVAGATCLPVCDPVVEACVDQVLTCSVTEVTLAANVALNRPSCAPCCVEWTRAGVGVIGDTPSITVRQPGTYTVTVTGADGCAVSDTVVVAADVEPPTVDATVDQSLTCAVTEVNLTAHVYGGRPPYAIEWVKAGVGVVGCGSCITVNEPGTYTVTVTGANGCSASDSVLVTQDAAPPVVDAAVGGGLSCFVTEVSLSVSVSGGRPPYSFAWTKPGVDLVSSSPSITVSEAGAYTVTVTGANGCSASDSVLVSEDAEPPAVDALVNGVLTCAATSVTLTASVSRGRPPYSIEWTKPGMGAVGSTTSIAVRDPGTYTVTVTGANGCWASDSVDVDQDIEPPVVDAGPDQLITIDEPFVTLTAKITGCGEPCRLTWENILGEVVGQTESITVNRPGAYRLTAVRANGCSASDEAIVNSTTVKEILVESSIEGLAVFGQLTLDGAPIPDTVFYFHVESTHPVDEEATASSITLTDIYGEGVEANGAEVNYIIPGNAIVSFAIHRDQFVAGKKYWLVHLPNDPPGEAAVAFF